MFSPATLLPHYSTNTTTPGSTDDTHTVSNKTHNNSATVRFGEDEEGGESTSLLSRSEPPSRDDKTTASIQTPLAALLEMGFSAGPARRALERNNGDLAQAVEELSGEVMSFYP